MNWYEEIKQGFVFNEDIGNINNALAKFKQACGEGKSSDFSGELSEIIQACGVFIEKIPAETRTRKTLQESWDRGLPNYATLEPIIQIQKNAVGILMAPPAKTIAEAEQLIMKDLARQEDRDSEAELDCKKMAYSKYNFYERWFRGRRSLIHWYYKPLSTQLKISSYQETLQKCVEEKEHGYLDNPDKHKATISAGKLYLADMKPLHTMHVDLPKRNLYHSVLFVVSLTGNLYVSLPDQEARYFFHSFLLAGKPVLCAGHLTVDNGEIVKILLYSGHYCPRKKELLAFLQLLKVQHKIDLSTIIVDDFAWRAAIMAERSNPHEVIYKIIKNENRGVSAEEYLRTHGSVSLSGHESFWLDAGDMLYTYDGSLVLQPQKATNYSLHKDAESESLIFQKRYFDASSIKNNAVLIFTGELQVQHYKKDLLYLELDLNLAGSGKEKLSIMTGSLDYKKYMSLSDAQYAKFYEAFSKIYPASLRSLNNHFIIVIEGPQFIKKVKSIVRQLESKSTPVSMPALASCSSPPYSPSLSSPVPQPKSSSSSAASPILSSSPTQSPSCSPCSSSASSSPKKTKRKLTQLTQISIFSPSKKIPENKEGSADLRGDYDSGVQQQYSSKLSPPPSSELVHKVC